MRPAMGLMTLGMITGDRNPLTGSDSSVNMVAIGTRSAAAVKAAGDWH